MNYRVFEVTSFFRATDPFFSLSNMSAFPIVVDGVRYNSSEALYQACKYSPKVECLPAQHKPGADPNVRNRIVASKNAMGAKMTQKCAVKADLVRPDWEDVKVDAMRWVLELKLQQHPDTFGKDLKRTGPKPIVERSSKDQFWGCVLAVPNFIGENYLGRLLTELRDVNFDRVLNGELTHPEGFLLKE